MATSGARGLVARGLLNPAIGQLWTGSLGRQCQALSTSRLISRSPLIAVSTYRQRCRGRRRDADGAVILPLLKRSCLTSRLLRVGQRNPMSLSMDVGSGLCIRQDLDLEAPALARCPQGDTSVGCWDLSSDAAPGMPVRPLDVIHQIPQSGS